MVKNIAYFQYPWRQWRVRLAGIYRYAERVGWHVQVIEHGLTALPVRQALKFWNPDGCIVERSVMELPGFRHSDFGDIPVVYCDANPSISRRPIANVRHDSSETAAIAANELFSLGLNHFAFVGNIIPREWSDRRREVLAKAVADTGGTFDAFEPGGPDSVSAFFASIRPWLRALPKPCGILAANDISGDLVLQACKMERLSVPDQIAVVGVDNDELVCMHTTPTLSSVRADFEFSGYLAAKLLDDIASGRASVPCEVRFSATEVVRRNSTRKFARRDDAVRHALELIRARACEGLTSAEVCKEIGGSRRQAEARFRALTDCSIGEEIVAVRIEHAKSLLLNRSIQIETIFSRCGYSDASSLRRAFKKATGLSPREWRRAQSAR